MDFLNLTLKTPAANLALDEALLLEAERGAGEVLRFWELPTYAVVLGFAGTLLDDVNERACIADGIPICRRRSGGGTVLLGPGCLVYSLVLSYSRPGLADVTSSYRTIMGLMARVLGELVGSPVRIDGSDLAVGDRKFSGNAQRRLRTHVLHHGTILTQFDLERVSRYLHLPQHQPAYRLGRDHAGFLTNLGLPSEAIQYALKKAWQAEHERTKWPEELVQVLVEERYGRVAWTQRC